MLLQVYPLVAGDVCGRLTAGHSSHEFSARAGEETGDEASVLQLLLLLNLHHGLQDRALSPKYRCVRHTLELWSAEQERSPMGNMEDAIHWFLCPLHCSGG